MIKKKASPGPLWRRPDSKFTARRLPRLAIAGANFPGAVFAQVWPSIETPTTRADGPAVHDESPPAKKNAARTMEMISDRCARLRQIHILPRRPGNAWQMAHVIDPHQRGPARTFARISRKRNCIPGTTGERQAIDVRHLLVPPSRHKESPGSPRPAHPHCETASY